MYSVTCKWNGWLKWGSLSVGILLLAACGNEQDASSGDAPGKEAQMPADEFRYGGADVLRVALLRPRRQPDVDGRLREWNQAFQVRLVLSDPSVWGPLVRLYLGEELIPEYGGWESGIYFWVYDPAHLERLNGRTISLQLESRQPQEVGRLELKPASELILIPEQELLRDQQS